MEELPKKTKPRSQAVAILKRFYAQSSDSDLITVNSIYLAAGRNLQNETRNRAWLANQLTVLRSYSFITTNREDTGRRRLTSIQLTPEGRLALGRGEAPLPEETDSHGSGPLPLEFVVSIIKTFQKQNPSVDVDFRISVKTEEGGRPRYRW